MSIIYSGKVIGFILGLIFFAVLIYGTRFLQGREIRRIIGLEAIEEAVGRAVEMGRPVHNHPGAGGFTGQYAQQAIAGIAITGHVARLCASRGADLEVTVRVAHTLPAVEEIVRTAYVAEGRPEGYDPDMIRFFPNQNALFSYCMGMFERRQIAANVMVGAYFWEAIVLAEHGGSVGAMQIGGTARQSQLPAFVSSCDYIIIGDEMFAAAAKVSNDRAQIGNIAGQDIMRIIISVIMVIGLLAALFGSNAIAEFLAL
jgi:hypothetical protein